METSSNHQDNHNPQLRHHSSTTTTSNLSAAATNNGVQLPSPKPISRSESTNPYPTTFVQADTSSFKQVVQMLTGSPKPTQLPDPNAKSHSHNIPPIKHIPKKTQTSSGFKLYERRNSLKNLKINPIFSPNNSGFSPRKPEILSPSILDFPALVLSPVTPLIPDPFDRSGSVNYTNSYGNNNPINNGNLLDTEAEEKAIKERGFFLHPSPASTPREAEPPQLLPLFPLTSPRISGSANPTS